MRNTTALKITSDFLVCVVTPVDSLLKGTWLPRLEILTMKTASIAPNAGKCLSKKAVSA